MKYLSVQLICMLLLSGFSLCADEKKEKPKTPLQKEMQKMNKAYKALREAFKNPDPAKTADYIQHAQVILMTTEKSMTMVPALISGMPDAEREKALEAYKGILAAQANAVKEMIRAFEDNSFEAAEAAFRKIRAEKGKGHDRYKEKDKK